MKNLLRRGYDLRLFVGLWLLSISAWGEEVRSAPTILHEIDAAAKPWTDDTPRFGSRDFQFAIVSDNSGGPRPGVFREGIEKCQLLQPDFVMSVGDFIAGRTAEDTTPDLLREQWNGIMMDIEGLTMPFFFVPGNHDVGGDAMRADVWRELFGKTYYYFLYQDVLFVVLCTNDRNGSSPGYSQEQMAWLDEVLNDHQDVRWTFVFQHHPFWLMEPSRWFPVGKKFDGRDFTAIAGHVHTYVYQESRNIQYLTLASTGGSSALRGPALGEIDHLMWVTMQDEGPLFASLELDGIRPADFRPARMALAFEAFRTENAIVSNPVIIEGDAVSKAAWQVRVTNPWDRPMRFKGLVEAEQGLAVSPSAVSSVVPAGETYEATISVAAETPISLSDMQPVALHWQVAYDQYNKNPIQLRGIHRMIADGIHLAPKRDTIVVDGMLDEWDALPFDVRKPAVVRSNEGAWRGPEDGAYRFAVAHDEETVYVAVRVEDDEVSTDDMFDRQDLALVWLRAAGEAPFEKEATAKSAVGIMAGVDVTENERERGERFAKKKVNKSVPLGARTAVQEIDGGLSYEFAFPLEKLRELGGDTAYIQVNVLVNDYDLADARFGISYLAWRPEWDGPQYDAAYGVFRLE